MDLEKNWNGTAMEEWCKEKLSIFLESVGLWGHVTIRIIKSQRKFLSCEYEN